MLSNFIANNSTDTIYGEFVTTSANVNLYGNILGSRSSTEVNDTMLYVYAKDNNWRLDWNGDTSTYTNTLDLTNWNTFNASPDGVTVDGVFYERTSQLGSQADYPFCIFTGYTVAGVLNTSQNLIGKSKGLEIVRNNVMQYNLIPVKRLSDNVVTLYDKVSRTYLTPLGTNAFTGVSKSTPEYIYS